MLSFFLILYFRNRHRFFNYFHLQNSQGILNDYVEFESSEDSTDLQNSNKGIMKLENNNIEKDEENETAT